MIVALGAIIGLAGTAAHAQTPAPGTAGAGGAASAAPAVDVADLPPLPAAEEDPSSSATLLAAAAAEEDVVVGAAKREQSLGNVASAVTVISADRIRRFGYRTIAEAIAAVAGVYVVDNRLSTSVGIRGLQVPGDFNTRVLVLVDGTTINEVWGAYAGVSYDAIVGIEDIARIEVIRGPVSSVYGTNAFFGIINIVTKGAAETPRAWARTGIHSINGVTTSAGFATGGVDRQLRAAVHFMDRLGGETTTLPEEPTIPLTRDGARSYAAGLVGVYEGSFLQVRARRYVRETPFAPYDASLVGSPYTQFDTQVLVDGGHTRDLTKRFTLAGRAYAGIYDYSDTAPPFDPVVEFALDTTGNSQIYGGELRGRYEVLAPDRLGITAGVEANYNQTRSTAYAANDPDTLIADVPFDYNLQGIYTEVDGQPTSWFGFTGGLRFDRHSRLEDKLSPRAALFVGKPERYGLKLLYALGFRNPSGFECCFEDGADFVAHPEDLKAETIRSYEAVVWAKPRPGLSTRVSGFYWDARDIIEAQPAPEDPTGSILQFQNVTRYLTRGVEAELSFRNSQGWYAFGGVALAQVGTEDATGSVVYGAVSNAPVITTGGGVSTPKLLDLAHISGEATYIGERPTRPDDMGMPSPASPPWFGINLTVFAPAIKGFDLTAGVRNLIGTRDLMPAPADFDRTMPDTIVISRVPGEGREVYVKLGYSY